MTTAIALAPVAGKSRIEVLDILRGLAILGIFYMNIPYEAVSVSTMFADIRLIGWTPGDQAAWAGIAIIAEGTQRCVLQFLFGAGMMVLTAKAMEPDGPVAVADLYYRRNLWLLTFGLFDIFGWLWTGDILTAYSLAALFLFPFRKLGPKLLIALGLVFALYQAVDGLNRYNERRVLIENVYVAQAHRAANQPLTAADVAVLKDWKDSVDSLRRLSPEQKTVIAAEAKAHQGGVAEYYALNWREWHDFFIGRNLLFVNVCEAFCAMLIGIALWKWGIIQGERSAQFYLVLMFAAYSFGVTARSVGVMEVFRFSPDPRTIWITSEPARLAMGLGHVALVNLLVRTNIGRAMLFPFKAAGRVAFSLYFAEQLIGVHILFSPYGFNLWNRFGWAGMNWMATAVIAFLLIVANIWVRYFANGPMEWAWRSLSYMQRQPFLKR